MHRHKAVREDESNIGFGAAFIRSITRFIPFEPFSIFGFRPWHDSIARTFVIDLRKSASPLA